MDNIKINIAILGTSGVGKTTLFNILTNQFYRKINIDDIDYTVDTSQIQLEFDNDFNVYFDVYDIDCTDDENILVKWIEENIKMFQIVIYIADTDNISFEHNILEHIIKYNNDFLTLCLLNKCDNIYIDNESKYVYFDNTKDKITYVNLNNLFANKSDNKYLMGFFPVSLQKILLYKSLNCIYKATSNSIFANIINKTFPNELNDTGFSFITDSINNYVTNNYDKILENKIKKDLDILTNKKCDLKIYIDTLDFVIEYKKNINNNIEYYVCNIDEICKNHFESMNKELIYNAEYYDNILIKINKINLFCEKTKSRCINNKIIQDYLLKIITINKKTCPDILQSYLQILLRHYREKFDEISITYVNNMIENDYYIDYKDNFINILELIKKNYSNDFNKDCRKLICQTIVNICKNQKKNINYLSYLVSLKKVINQIIDKNDNMNSYNILEEIVNQFINECINTKSYNFDFIQYDMSFEEKILKI